MITSESLKPDPEKIAAVKQTTAPRDREELDTIFGIINYFAKFAPKSEINNLICKQLAKDIEFLWDTLQYDALKRSNTLLPLVPTP